MSSSMLPPNNNNNNDNDISSENNQNFRSDETNTSGSSEPAMESLPQNGIDIRAALDILSARSSSSHGSHRHLYASSGASPSGGGCPICAGTKIPEEAKSMGQTIFLHEEGTASTVDSTTTSNTDQDLEAQRLALAQDRARRKEEINAKLQSMTVSELIQAVLEAQRERVATYREFDRGLDLVLQTGNMSEYPAICARATASFAVLSDTITTIQSILHPQSKLLAQLITKLQGQEREKLNLTAALHLERIRFESTGANEPDDTVRNLLQEGMQSLRTRVNTCVEQINEILEDIRMEVMSDE